MATLALQPLRFNRHAGIVAEEFGDVEFATLTTFIQGDLLNRVANLGVVVSDNPTKIAYLAEAPSTAAIPGHINPVTSNPIMSMMRIKTSDQLEISLWAASAAAAVLADSEINDLRTFALVKKTVSGVAAWVADKTDPAASHQALALVSRISSATDQYPRLIVRVLPSVAGFMSGSLS